MSRMDELPPDQRAALSLLLRQHKSYAEVAALLGIAERAVHDRAHAALAVLAPRRARELTPERREEIGDYLLGQQPGVAERLRTRAYLTSSESARAWAGELAAQLAPLAGASLPEIPAGPTTGERGPQRAGEPGPQRVGDLSSSVAASSGAGAPAPTPARSQRSSRAGGAILLAVLAAAVIVAVVLLTGGSSPKKSSSTATSQASSTVTKTGPTIDAQISLKPSNSTSKSVGAAYVLSEGAKRALFIDARNLPPAKGFYYAIWLYNSSKSFVPVTKSSAVTKHRLEGISPLPSNAGEFHEVLLTTETSSRPTHPGHVVLRGRFSLT
ncbi:MAG TPA: sigma-70 region 4 domain-containing protein [Solirubrobacteraceae bacterium]|nr:sigma-70 region 4 domain-containing protein [Solirubrobacteraceae bacterium]